MTGAGAIFSYNHAEWYVEEVEAKAAKIGSGGELVCEAAPAEPFGELPPRSLARVQAVAQWIESKRIHYCWGGGHGAQPGPSPGSGEFCPVGDQGSRLLGLRAVASWSSRATPTPAAWSPMNLVLATHLEPATR